VGQDEPTTRIRSYRGAEVRETPWLPPNADIGELNTFVRPRQMYGDAKYFASGLYRDVYAPIEVGSELRTLAMDGDRFLGWLGLIRRGKDNRFTSRETRLLSATMPEVASALCAIDALERDFLSRDIAAVMRPNGRIEHASSTFVDWLDDDKADYLRRRINRLDQTGDGSGVEYVETAEVRVIRLDAGYDTADGIRYMVTVGRAELWQIRPVHRLTERQREVADFAAAGATAQEIADTLDISKNTVKQHLKNIYERLGIGSRAELVAQMTDARD
jgi:DNA-binding CsgD family transcriptional regulator